MSQPRRTPGLSAFSRSTLSASSYASHGTALRASHTTSLATQLSVFQSLLQQFSLTHGKEIRSNPAFRAEFARMCNAIGVDPLLASNSARGVSGVKGAKEGQQGSVWAQMLGGSVNDWYFELAVRVVEVCQATRDENGGMMGVEEVVRRVQRGRGAQGQGLVGNSLQGVSDDDVRRAVRSLEPLGGGFALVRLGSKEMIRSVPRELNRDQATVLEAVQVLGFVTVEMLMSNLRWKRVRATAVIDDLVAESMVWVDGQSEEKEFWSPMSMNELVGD